MQAIFFGQVPGADEAIRAAASRGWEAVVLVVIMISVLCLLGWIVKVWITRASQREDKILEQALAREDRLAKRIDALEDFIRTSLMDALHENTRAMLNISVASGEITKAMSDLIGALHTTRVCFATGDQQVKLIETIAAKVSKEIVSAVGTDHAKNGQ